MDNVIKDNINISQHAKERYAERIKRKTELIDINRFIIENEEKITKDIKLMIQYAECIYIGKNTKKDRFGAINTIAVYVKDTWVLIYDTSKNTLVTLFKIETGLDDDFNKLYTDKMIEKLKIMQKEAEDTKERVRQKNNELKIQIEEHNGLILEYKNYIKKLEEANNGYKAIMESNLIKVSQAEDDVEKIIDRLVSKNKLGIL